eukprot:g16762.t1
MSRLTDPARLQKEIDAQKKRAEALALLSSTDGEPHFKPGEVRKAREAKEGDNTLEVVTLRKAQQTYQELRAKERLLKQQNSVRESVQKKQSGAAAAAVEPLREGWKEIKDPKTGSTYYWNKSSNATSWERPVKEAASTQPTNANPNPLGARGTGKEGGGGAATGKHEGGEGRKPPPLPAGWKELKDPKTGGVYYWNQSEGATTWVRPTGPPSEGGGGGTTPGLPEGWKAVTHAATGQTHYVHEASGKRSYALPGSQPEASSSSSPQQQGQSHAERGGGAAGGRGSDGRNRSGSDRPKKKGRGGGSSWAIDPLDPTGKTGGKWSDGLVQVGERMADSTASGPLWQQRPYPAPGKILRGREPTEAETAGPRQR